MTKKTRRIIFYIFLIIFLILTPTIILYALGYSVDFEKKTIVATGGIDLKSTPSGAEIYINYKPRGTTNKFVKRLVPKIYDVEIAKENYNHWQKKLVVEPGLVTKINNVLLIPSNLKMSLLPPESEEYSLFKNIYPLPMNELFELIKIKSKSTISKIENLNLDKKDKLYFIANNNLYYLKFDENAMSSSILSPAIAQNVINYVIYKDGVIYLDNLSGKIFELNLTTLKSTEMFEQVFPSLNKGKWILSDDNKKLLCQKDTAVEVLWIDNINGSIQRKKGDIEKIDFGQKINQVIWYAGTDEHLIIATNNSVLITEIDNRFPRNTINLVNAETPQIKYDAGKKILYFLSQNKLYQTEL